MWFVVYVSGGVPFSPVSVVPEQIRDLPRAFVPEAASVPQARRVLINRAYLEKFGFTPECSKCKAIQAGDNSRASQTARSLRTAHQLAERRRRLVSAA